MNNNYKKLQAKVHSAVYHLIKEKGVASPVDVFISIGVLSKDDYERWRFGKVDFLERVCNMNLHKLSVINHEIRSYAQKHELKPSWTAYNKWGKGNKTRLRFSKFGNENVEKHYATHYVSKQKIEEAKPCREARRAKYENDAMDHDNEWMIGLDEIDDNEWLSLEKLPDFIIDDLFDELPDNLPDD
jgi:hypothetical protein